MPPRAAHCRGRGTACTGANASCTCRCTQCASTRRKARAHCGETPLCTQDGHARCTCPCSPCADARHLVCVCGVREGMHGQIGGVGNCGAFVKRVEAPVWMKGAAE